MSGILTPGERQGQWQIAGDHDRRIRALEAVDPCDCIDPSRTLADVIIANPCVSGFWKLDETSGDTAEDSVGSHDMVSGAGDPPTWAADTTPFDTDAAGFGTGLIEESTTFPALSGDFTLEMWGKRTGIGTGAGTFFTQGDPVPANQPGVAFFWLPSSQGNQIVGFVGDSTGGPHVVGTGGAAFTDLDWHYVVLVRDTNIWTLYVNATANGATYDDGGTNYTPIPTTGLAIGNKQGTLAADYFPGYLAYGAVYNCALTLPQIEEHYALGTSSGGVADGWVLTWQDGEPVWLPPTIEVEW